MSDWYIAMGSSQKCADFIGILQSIQLVILVQNHVSRPILSRKSHPKMML
jgi:hypothetical protein